MLTKMFSGEISGLTKEQAWLALYEMFGQIEGSDRFLNRLKNKLIPKIEKIVKIYLNDETSIDILRSGILDDERRNGKISYTRYENMYGSELVGTFTRRDCPNYSQFRRIISGTSGAEYRVDNRALQNRTRSNQSSEGDISDTVKHSVSDTVIEFPEAEIVKLSEENLLLRDDNEELRRQAYLLAACKF